MIELNIGKLLARHVGYLGKEAAFTRVRPTEKMSLLPKIKGKREITQNKEYVLSGPYKLDWSITLAQLWSYGKT